MTGARRVLMVEDNPLDVDLVCMAFDEMEDWPIEITVASDGEEAIKLLQAGVANSELRPDLVLLDLNIPRCDGTEVLQVIRGTERLSDLLVAVFSSSPRDVIQDKLTLAGVAADAHFTKPRSFDAFKELSESLRNLVQSRGHSV